MNLNNTVTHCIAAESKGICFYYLSFTLKFVHDSLARLSFFFLEKRLVPISCLLLNCVGIKFQAAKLRGDVIHYSWLFDCCSQKKLLPLKPKLVVPP